MASLNRMSCFHICFVPRHWVPHVHSHVCNIYWAKKVSMYLGLQNHTMLTCQLVNLWKALTFCNWRCLPILFPFVVVFVGHCLSISSVNLKINYIFQNFKFNLIYGCIYFIHTIMIRIWESGPGLYSKSLGVIPYCLDG